MSVPLKRGLKRAAIVASAVVVVSLAGAAPVHAGSPGTTQVGETATLAITKTVVGEAPDGAEFTILIECESSGPYELTFGSTGGDDSVVFFSRDVCVISEPDDGGASSTTGLGTIEIENPTFDSRTVANSFETEPTSSSTAGTVASAAATRPTFTG